MLRLSLLGSRQDLHVHQHAHEWCAEGIKPEIDGQQTCNLADLVEFNAHITSGRDFLFTDIDAIDAGSRDWLEPQGIK